MTKWIRQLPTLVILPGLAVIGACSHASPGNHDRTSPARQLALSRHPPRPADVVPVRAPLAVSAAAACGFPAGALNQERSPAVEEGEGEPAVP